MTGVPCNFEHFCLFVQCMLRHTVWHTLPTRSKLLANAKIQQYPTAPYLPCNYPVCATAASAIRSSRVHNKTATENEFGVCGTKR